MAYFIIGALVGFAIGVALMGFFVAFLEDEYHFYREAED